MLNLSSFSNRSARQWSRASRTLECTHTANVLALDSIPGALAGRLPLGASGPVFASRQLYCRRILDRRGFKRTSDWTWQAGPLREYCRATPCRK